MVFVILLAVLILYFNIKGYRRLFISREKQSNKIKEALSKMKEKDAETVKGIAIISMILICIPYFIFYGVATSIFSGNTVLIFWIIVQIVFTIVSLKNSILLLTNENRKIKSNILQRICHPFNTVFILYFIYFCIDKV